MSRSSTDTDTNVRQLHEHDYTEAAAQRLIEYIEEVQERANHAAPRHLRIV